VISVVLGGVALNVKGTSGVVPDGYRPLVESDIGKEFGVELDEKIYFDDGLPYCDYAYSLMGSILWGDFSDSAVMIDWVVPEALYLLELRSGDVVSAGIEDSNIIYFQGGNLINDIEVYSAWFEDGGPGEEYYGYGFSLSDFTVPAYSYINDIYFDDIKSVIYVKDIEEEFPGYRPLVDSDIGKDFGVELDCKIIFTSGLSVPIYENNTLLIDWVVPDAVYMFELRTTVLTFDGNNLYERFNYFQGGDLQDEIDIMTTYSYVYDIYDETTDYYITDYTLPLLSSINEIYYDYAKDLILVKDLSLTDYEMGYIYGYETGKEDYGGFIDGQWFTAEDYGAWEYDRGLSDSIDVVGVMVGGVFGSLTALGNVEILPGLKIFYIVGIFVVFGVVGFIIQKKFGGDD